MSLLHAMGWSVLPLLGAALVSDHVRAAENQVTRVEYVDARTGWPFRIPDLAKWEARLAPLLSNVQTAEGAEAVVDALLDHLRAHGRPVMEVEFAPAESPGMHEPRVAALRVWPGLIRSVSLEGGSPWMREAVAGDWARRAGAEIEMSTIDAWLDWTHRNPFHQVVLTFEPGAEAATADAVLALQSETLVRPFLTWRDDGIEPLGPQRFSAGLEIGDLGGAPVWVSAELVGGEDWPDYRSVRGQLRWFLPWHHELRLAGSWTTAELDGFLPGLPITSSLRSVDMAARYVVPLGKWAGWRADGGLGFDFRRTESGVSLDGEDERGEADTAQFVADAMVRRATSVLESVAVASVFWSPGGLTAFNDTEDADVLRPGAEADYFGVRGEAVARWELPRGWAVLARGAAQWTSDPPLPTVQLPVSGAYAVRGFDEAVVLADAGAWGGIEVQAPAWSALESWGGSIVTPVVFADAGWARNEAEDDETSLASLGVGVRWRSGRRASLAFDYGWRLTEPGGRAHFALVVSF
ncbi:MAG: ShlB/FhaC/HecB family hemolysin secretion/activation protein [Verrucomicrobiales bacterium]